MSPPSSPRILTPDLLIRAYASGVFPMAERRDDPTVFWVDPQVRGILPLDGFHVSRSLRKAIRKAPYEIRCDTACPQVIGACAGTDRGRDETWINAEIEAAYVQLHGLGFVHSVEAWSEGELVGGLYGVALGGAFFGESMFSRRPDASKVALVHLVAILRLGGYVLLDTQFVTDHLKQFGAVEIPARDYLLRLDEALQVKATFDCAIPPATLAAELESLFQGPGEPGK